MTAIFNLSIKFQTVPCIWTLANISLISKETPLSQSLNQLRPISVTDIIIRLLKKIIYVVEVKPVIRSHVSSDQFRKAYGEGTNEIRGNGC